MDEQVPLQVQLTLKPVAHSEIRSQAVARIGYRGLTADYLVISDCC